MSDDDKPTITVTEAAAKAFRDALAAEDSDDVVRLSINNHFQNDLFIGAKEADDVVVTSSGLTIAMDAGTARRADGLTIDFASGPGGTGFKIENPNQSPPVKGICPADLVRLIERGEKLEFIDVRGPEERAKASVEGARPLDAAYEAALAAMPKTSKLVFMAHHGADGRSVGTRYYKQGFTNVWYLVGGIDGWSTMDPNIPRY